MHGDRAVLAAPATRGDLDVDADPDAELDGVARLAAGALLLAELVVVGEAQGLAQRQVVVADVVARAGQRGDRERRRVEEVAPPQLGRVDGELDGGQVEHALQVGGGLRAARAAERAHRRGVGERDRAVEGDLRDVVDALAHDVGGAERERAAEARVGARVADDPRPQAGDPPFPGEAQLVVGDLAAPVGHRDEVLRAGLDPADRPPQRAGHADRHGVLGQHPGLTAEAAADVRGDHAHALGVEAEDLRRLVAEAVRHLGGDPDRQLVVAAVVAAREHRDRVALQRHHRHPLVDHPSADDDLGVGQHGLGVLGCAALARGEVVAAVELRGGPFVEARPRGRRRRAAGRSPPPPARRRRPRRPSSPRRRRPRPRPRSAPGRWPAAGAAAPG